MATGIIQTPTTAKLPNLDCMSPKDLMAFCHTWCHPSRARAVTLVGYRRNAVKHVRTMAQYAHMKAIAMTYRRRGHINLAVKYEDNCDILYTQLPVDLRW
jgi:hypothetical protein